MCCLLFVGWLMMLVLRVVWCSLLLCFGFRFSFVVCCVLFVVCCVLLFVGCWLLMCVACRLVV